MRMSEGAGQGIGGVDDAIVKAASLSLQAHGQLCHLVNEAVGLEDDTKDSINLYG